jgi:tetratricopeptide (TPR) repeat protein
VISFLLGCVKGGAQSVTAGTSSPLILPAHTPVTLHLKESLYKKDAKPGYSLEFEVGDDVLVNGQILIQSGTAVIGSVRRVDPAGTGEPTVLIDLGPVKTVSGETVALASPSFSSNRESPAAEAAGMGSAAGPILPALLITSLFQKRVLLDKDAWGGIWGEVQTAENVALDPAKQKAAQEQYIANRQAARAKLCELLASPDSPNWDRIGGWEAIFSLVRRSGLDDSRKADLLRSAGDLDGAIDAYQKLLASKPDLPCSDKYPELSSGAPLVFALAVPDKREQLLKSFRANLHLELAGLYREKRDFVHTISECRTAVQLAPEDERTRTTLIGTLQDSGDLDAAIAESNEAIRIWPGNSYFHYLLGTVLVKKNDADAAIVELQWVLKQEKNHDWRASCALGSAYELKGDLKAAFAQYRVAHRVPMNDEKCRASYERLKLQLKK